MKLDLLYEFQPKVKPWDLPHPYGQRQAEQARLGRGAVREHHLDRHARLVVVFSLVYLQAQQAARRMTGAMPSPAPTSARAFGRISHATCRPAAANDVVIPRPTAQRTS